MVFPEIFPEQIGDPELTGKSRDIGPLVDNFQDKLSQFSKIPFNKIRYLGKIMGQDWDKLSQNTGNSIIINEKSIPITPENKDIKPIYDNFQASLAHFSSVPFNKIRYLGKELSKNRADFAQNENSIEVKRSIGHGNWLPWLEAEFGWSRNTAAHFMQVADKFSNVRPVAHLDFAPKALYLLAQNNTPEEVRQNRPSKHSHLSRFRYSECYHTNQPQNG